MISVLGQWALFKNGKSFLITMHTLNLTTKQIQNLIESLSSELDYCMDSLNIPASTEEEQGLRGIIASNTELIEMLEECLSRGENRIIENNNKWIDIDFSLPEYWS